MTPEKSVAKKVEWVKKFLALNAHPDELEDCVYEATSALCSTVNNAGVEAQVEFIFDHLGEEELEKAHGSIWQGRDNC